jgi:4-amino-4-deoxy-L-arabinose transferase-like glycosyltransferase
MTQAMSLDSLARGWRGPLLAALIAFVAALPGLICVPPLDRDESLFAEATAQMLESGDFVSIRYQDEPRDKKPVGVYWLQAASVATLSSAEARQIWAYRIPSLLGAMLAAAALAWGAARFVGPGAALGAGAILGGCLLLSVEGGIAKTDAVLCGATTLTMAAFAQIYGAARGVGPPAGRRVKAVFWLGLALAILDKGPIGPMVAALAGLGLWAWDGGAPWARGLGWSWGLILIAAIVGPWAMAITVATDGAFWTGSVGHDMAAKIAGARGGHGGPPGLHALLAILLMFPASALIPAGLAAAWKARTEPGVRFAVAWLAPTWTVFELAPTKLPHYPLPAYGALAWLCAMALFRPIGTISAWTGAAFSLIAASVVAAAAGVLQTRYGGPDALAWAAAAESLAVLAGLAGIAVVLSGRPRAGLAAALALGVAAHASLAGLAPRLDKLWLSRSMVAALGRAGLDPRNGLTPGPVTVVGYRAPSAVFLLGADTVLGDVGDAANAIYEGRPAFVEDRLDGDFQRELTADGLSASAVGAASGLDYTYGRTDMMRLYRSNRPPGPEADQGGAGP